MNCLINSGLKKKKEEKLRILNFMKLFKSLKNLYYLKLKMMDHSSHRESYSQNTSVAFKKKDSSMKLNEDDSNGIVKCNPMVST